MGYCIIDTPEIIEVHSDICDKMFEKKENAEFNNTAHYLEFFTFEDVKTFLKNENNKNKEIIFCKECNPDSGKYDEEGDDFYEEFDDEDENECLI